MLHTHSPPISSLAWLGWSGTAAPCLWLFPFPALLSCASRSQHALTPRNNSDAEGENTHQVLLGGSGVFTEAGRREGSHTGWGDGGYKADKIQNDPCTHPNPGKGGGAAGAQEDGLGKDSKGPESLGWGAQGLVNIDHSQKGMGVGEGSPYTSSQG